MKFRLVKKDEKSAFFIFIGLIGLIGILGLNTQYLKPADRYLSDIFLNLSSNEHAPDDIVVVDITDVTLDLLGEWPWPRSLTANLLSQITKQNPKMIGLDIIFPDTRGPEGDALLVQSIKDKPVCLPIIFEYDSENLTKKIGYLPQSLPLMKSGIEAFGFIGNFESLARQTSCSGHISPLMDEDGKTRKLPRWVSMGNQSWPTLALGMALKAEEVGFFDSNAPQLEDIPYRIIPETWKVIPAEQVLYQQLPSNYFKDKWVLIGSSALGLSDLVSTPINPRLPGVFIHAEMLNTYLNTPSPSPWSAFSAASIATTLLLSFVAGLATLYIRPLIGISIAISSTLAWSIIAWFAWLDGTHFSIAYPIISFALLLIVLVPQQWLSEIKRRTVIENLFKGYLTPHLVDKLIQSPDVALAPQKRLLTILFADVEGFTNFSKTHSASETSVLAQKILMFMTLAVQEHEGTIDKYIGDEIMAFWNAPFEQADQADLALKTAYDICKRLTEFNDNTPDYADLIIRIGISTGEVIVGDLGTPFRRSYTVVGFAVNEAHKLTQKAKPHNKRIAISQSTNEKLTISIDESLVVVDHS